MLVIKEKLKRKIEKFLRTWPDHWEFGGFLLANKEGVVVDFYPLPNVYERPEDRYQLPNRSEVTTDKLARSMNMEVVAFWHSHPNPHIMSQGDEEICRVRREQIFVLRH